MSKTYKSQMRDFSKKYLTSTSQNCQNHQEKRKDKGRKRKYLKKLPQPKNPYMTWYVGWILGQKKDISYKQRKYE